MSEGAQRAESIGSAFLARGPARDALEFALGDEAAGCSCELASG